MRFYIVDDEQSHIDTLKRLLIQAFPGSTVIGQKAENWVEAYTWIMNNVPDSDECVLLPDLSLGGQLDMAEDGLRNIQRVSQQLKNVVLVLYSQFRPRAEADPRYKRIFRTAIDKQPLWALLDGGKEQEAINHVKTRILSVIQPSRLTDRNIFEDSYAMRLLSAAFGESLLTELISNVAQGYSSIRVRALTGGYSGAFLLSIAGALEGKAQSLVVKIAREKTLLEQELESLYRHMSELGPLQGCLVTTDRSIVTLPSGDAHYFRQAEVPGRDLLTAVETLEPGDDAHNLTSPLLGMIVACCDSCLAQQQPSTFADHFRLTQVDISRFMESVPFLRRVARTMESQGKWPPEPVALAAQLGAPTASVVSNWAAFAETQGETYVSLQHGDLNPRNVMLLPDNRPVLIDLSRLGHWPIAYDPARLALQLRIRLTGSADKLDYFPESLALWLQEPVGNIDSRKEVSGSTCPPAAYVENSVYDLARGKPGGFGEILKRAFEIGTAWDLIKIVSYNDLSAFKRVWALHECDRLISRLSGARLPPKP